ncbi:tripartite tricarboxylate transporter TctB family protein [Streptomyces sp. ID38640]|uniref:tripartite tricarboxylate transporter TctB family protein n=1 Tax=Streptomyces sp. ID38640 TaxID=1265399 RepID=UPI00140F10A0|nr:tripartite tricarboxylate transporter TctB family protein [Streptomyces sp. ID38640]QIK07860.1 tripartite tricarboxylate transporter TctB family protein [Streptomyces sp. ID38640]
MTASQQKRSSPDRSAGQDGSAGQPPQFPRRPGPGGPTGRPGSGRPPLGPRAMALFILAVGLTVLIGAFLIPEGGGFQTVGPRPFPILVGAAGTLIGAIGVVQAFLGPRLGAVLGSRPGRSAGAGEPAERAEPTEQAPAAPARWRPTLILLGALVTYTLLMPFAGYWQVTTVFYAASARIQGSRNLRRDVLIGLALALATYFVFDRLFGINLPPGYLRLAF